MESYSPLLYIDTNTQTLENDESVGSEQQKAVSLNSPKYRIKGTSPVYIYFIVMYTHLCPDCRTRQ